MNARSQANHCRRRGILKPEPCEITGCADPVQMHHDDYSKPLEVRWLCKTHHQQLHAALRWPMDGPQSMSAAEIAAWAEAV